MFACLRKWCCGFNLVTFSVLLLVFFVASSITSSVQTNNNYNSTPETEWILVGGITSSSATFRVRAKDKASERMLVVSLQQDLSDDKVFESLVSDGKNADQPVQTFSVDNLESNTRYYYGTMDLISNIIKSGSFSTPLTEGQRFNFTIATAGCAWTGSKAKVFETIAKEEPLMFLHMGDFHYEDIGEDDLNKRINAMDMVLGSSSQASLFSQTALAYMWDDHDFTGDESNSLGKGRESALQSYRVGFPFYEPLPASENAAEGEEVSPYHAFTIGTVRFLICDLRSEANLTDIYSDQQKAWLFEEIANADSYDFVVLVSTKPWIGPATTTQQDDSWWAYPNNRAELSNYISETIGTAEGPQNLLMVASDAHMVAFDDGSNTYYGSSDAASLSFPILQTGPMDRLGSAKGTAFTHGCHTTRYERNHQYSVIQFQMPLVGEPCMQIASYDADRNEIISTQLCGKIFQSSENVGTGSCSGTTLTGKSWAVFGVEIGFLCLLGLASCCFLSKCKGLAVFMVALVIGFGTLAVGFGIPLARDVPQFNTFDILVIGMVQMIVAFFHVVLWIRVTRRNKQEDDDGPDPKNSGVQEEEENSEP